MFLLALLSAYGCTDDGPKKSVIAVSFDSQRWILEQIAGDDYDVVTLLPQGSDPEMFDPDMRAMKGLERADMYLTTNTLGFEERTLDRIRANYPDLPVVDLTTGIEIMMHTHEIAGVSAAADADGDHHGHGHEHHAGESHQVGDPHLLSSLRNARIVARNTLDVLSEHDPARSGVYRRNFERLDSMLMREDLRADSLIGSRCRGGSFVVMHPSLSYYARDYGLVQIPLEVDGKEASPRQLEERLRYAEASRPRALFYERGHNEEQARQIAEALGVEAYPLTPNGADFIRQTERVTQGMIGAPEK